MDKHISTLARALMRTKQLTFTVTTPDQIETVRQIARTVNSRMLTNQQYVSEFIAGDQMTLEVRG